MQVFMNFLIRKAIINNFNIIKMKNTLDRYFDAQTNLAYIYPAGQEKGKSKFLNSVTPWIEELVAARSLITGTDSVGNLKILTFDDPDNKILRYLSEELGYDVTPEDRIIRISIPRDIQGSVRNELLSKKLIDLNLRENSLIMAQPLFNAKLRSILSPINDAAYKLGNKRLISLYFPDDNLPTRLKRYESGEEFFNDFKLPDFPFVVKVANSSSGDGVQVCFSERDLILAKSRFKNVPDAIMIDQYILGQNIGVQFGMTPSGEFDVIGMNSQIVSDYGEFVGGIVRADDEIPFDIKKMLNEKFSLVLKDNNWNGVGGIDFIDNKAIDLNARQTAMTWLIFQQANGLLRGKNALAFNGQIFGDIDDIKQKLSKYAMQGGDMQVLNIAALIATKVGMNINGAVLFDQDETLFENIRLLKKLFDINAGAFNQIMR